MQLNELILKAKEAKKTDAIYRNWYAQLLKRIINKPELGLYIGSSQSSHVRDYPEELHGLCHYLYHKTGTEYRDVIVKLVSDIVEEYERGSVMMPSSIWAYQSGLPYVSVIPLRLFDKAKLVQIYN